MTDIIQDAKRLLDGATPGPWEWVGYDIEQTTEAGGGMVMDVSCDNPHSGWIEPVEIAPDDEALIAAAPELASALAEEVWEYRHEYQVTGSQQWHPLTDWAEGEPDRRPWNITPARIVRRRVSKPEVIEDA